MSENTPGSREALGVGGGAPGFALSRTCSADQRELVRRWLRAANDGGHRDDAFRQLDINGDGFVTLPELKEAVKYQAPEWQNLPEALLAMADTDNDGKISISEFQALGKIVQGNDMLLHSIQQSVHEHITCDMCKASPIVGNRYKCLTCWDYDLCADCHALPAASEHIAQHDFRLMEHPTPSRLDQVKFQGQTLTAMDYNALVIAGGNGYKDGFHCDGCTKEFSGGAGADW